MAAIENAQFQKGNFDTSRIPGHPAPTLWIGPCLDGDLVEVMTFRTPPATLVIFHCMEARPKFLTMMRRPQ